MEMETYGHRLHRKMKTEIPIDILSCEILSRLSVKSVLRFKCVSKQWHSLLTTQMFKKAHLDLITDDYHQNPIKVLLLYAPSPYEFRTIDCEAPTDGLTRNRSLPFLSRPANIEILASFHGLVCVGRIKISDSSFFSELIIWNPSTGEFKTVKNYDRCVYIYSLKYDSWRKVDGSTHNLDDVPYFRRERWNCWSLCTWLDKDLYFIMQCLTGEGSDPWSYSILKFDTSAEKFTQIQTPTSKIHKYSNYFLTVQRGKIHYLWVKYDIASRKTYIRLWSLNGDGDSWDPCGNLCSDDGSCFFTKASAFDE